MQVNTVIVERIMKRAKSSGISDITELAGAVYDLSKVVESLATRLDELDKRTVGSIYLGGALR